MPKTPASGNNRQVGPASINAVAAHAGVSIATVSRVMNGVAKKAAPATITRVQEAIAALDYRPASAGRSLRQQTSGLVAVLAANLANPAMTAIAASVEIALRKHGLVMVLCDTHDKTELQDEYLREMLAQQARAIVMLGAVDSPMLRKVKALHLQLIFVNRRDPTETESTFVGIDNRKAGYDVARWVIAQGSRKTALIHAPTSSSATRDRVSGILKQFVLAGAALATNMVLSPNASDHLTIGRDAARRIIEGGGQPDFVICTSDLIAFGAARAWREARLCSTSPRLIGFDDSPMNEWLAPNLSSVRIPYEAFGEAIVSLVSGSNKNIQTILPHSIIERIHHQTRG